MFVGEEPTPEVPCTNPHRVGLPQEAARSETGDHNFERTYKRIRSRRIIFSSDDEANEERYVSSEECTLGFGELKDDLGDQGVDVGQDYPDFDQGSNDLHKQLLEDGDASENAEDVKNPGNHEEDTSEDSVEARCRAELRMKTKADGTERDRRALERQRKGKEPVPQKVKKPTSKAKSKLKTGGRLCRTCRS